MRSGLRVVAGLVLLLAGLGVEDLFHAHLDGRHHVEGCPGLAHEPYSHGRPVVVDASAPLPFHGSCPPCSQPLTHAASHAEPLAAELPVCGDSPARGLQQPRSKPRLGYPQRGPPEV